MTWLINPYRFRSPAIPVVGHRYARMVPLVPGNYATSNEWGLGEIQMSETSGGVNLIPDSTATATAIISNRTGIPRDLLEGRVGDYAPNEMLGSHWQVDAGGLMLPRYVRHTARVSAFNSQAPIVFAWVYSEDGVTWFGRGIIDDSATGAYAATETREYLLSDFALPNERSQARMWAIDCSEGNGANPVYVIYGDVAFATSPGGASVTTGGLPMGAAVRAFDTLPDAFDGNATTSFGPRVNYYYGRTVGYYWATPQPGIVECRLTAHTGDTSYMVKSGNIVWSSDGVNWNVAGSFSGETGWSPGETRTFAVSA